MATKDQIINNLREYSAADIVQAIRCGEISLYELSKSGKLTPLLKKRIEEQMDAIEDSSTSAKESEPINGESANVSDAVLTETQEITQEIISAPIDSVITVEAPSVIPTDNRIYEEYVEKQKMFSTVQALWTVRSKRILVYSELIFNFICSRILMWPL